MNPMMMPPGGGMGMPGGMMPPMGGGAMPNPPMGVDPMSMMKMLQMLQDPMGLASASQPQQPLSPQEQAMLLMMTNGGQKQTPTGDVPGMMQMLQALGLGSPGGGSMQPPSMC